MFVINGVSGNTGSAAAEALLAAGAKVRVVVRDEAKGAPWKARGAEVALASIEDVASMTAALRGATGAYILLPPPAWNEPNVPANRAALTEKLLSAVRAAAPEHTVFLSSIAAHHAAGTGPIQFLQPIERALKSSGLRATLLRAGWFMENWGASLAGALASGSLYYGLESNKRFAQVATKDIGATAARALLDPHASGARVIELSGPEELSLADVAAVISKISGKTIAAVTVPVEGMVASLEGMGASKDVAAGYGEMVAGLNSGHVAWEGGGATALRGSTTIETVLRAMLPR